MRPIIIIFLFLSLYYNKPDKLLQLAHTMYLVLKNMHFAKNPISSRFAFARSSNKFARLVPSFEILFLIICKFLVAIWRAIVAYSYKLRTFALPFSTKICKWTVVNNGKCSRSRSPVMSSNLDIAMRITWWKWTGVTTRDGPDRWSHQCTNCNSIRRQK